MRKVKPFVTAASLGAAFLAADAHRAQAQAFFNVTGSSLTGQSTLYYYSAPSGETEGVNTTINESGTAYSQQDNQYEPYVEMVSNMGSLLTSDANTLQIQGSASVYGTTRDSDSAANAGEIDFTVPTVGLYTFSATSTMLVNGSDTNLYSLTGTQGSSTVLSMSYPLGDEFLPFLVGPSMLTLSPGVQYALKSSGMASGPEGSISGSDGSPSFTVSLTAVPEPASIGLLAGGLMTLLRRRHRSAS